MFYHGHYNANKQARWVSRAAKPVYWFGHKRALTNVPYFSQTCPTFYKRALYCSQMYLYISQTYPAFYKRTLLFTNATYPTFYRRALLSPNVPLLFTSVPCFSQTYPTFHKRTLFFTNVGYFRGQRPTPTVCQAKQLLPCSSLSFFLPQPSQWL